MTQEVGSFWESVPRWIGWVVAVASVLILALTERLRKVFPSREMQAKDDRTHAAEKVETDRRLTRLETQMESVGKDITLAIQAATAEMKDSFTDQLNRFGKRLEEDEKTMVRIEKAVASLQAGLDEINKHGTGPLDDLKTSLHLIERTLDRQADQLEHLKTLGPCKHETK